MKKIYSISTKNLEIVSFQERFLSEKYVNWLNNKELMRYSDQRFKIHTKESCVNYFKSFKGSENKFWAILAKDNDDKTHIGNITTTFDINHGVVDISILIGDKNFHGRGFGKESWLSMIQYLSKDVRVRKITAGTLEVNKPMLSLIKFAKMTKDGTKVKQCRYNDKYVDMLYFSLFPKH